MDTEKYGSANNATERMVYRAVRIDMRMKQFLRKRLLWLGIR